MSEPTQSASQSDGQSNGQGESRRHFLVDINTVFGLFGKRYFLIFYFGRHLHPRQREQLVNQRRTGNWLVIIFILLLLTGLVVGTWQMVAWRLGHDKAGPADTGSFTELNIQRAPATQAIPLV